MEIISMYTRAQALEDGELVDVSRWASPKEMMGGFKVPVAMTRALWAAVEAIPDALEGIADVRGRAHDVLWMARCALAGSARRNFRVVLPVAGSRKKEAQLVVDLGPGDTGEPVVTIGFPDDF